jgi:hypothetical protein
MEDGIMIARVTQAWRDAWPSRPLTTAITLGFVAVGVAVGLPLGLLFGDGGAGSALGLVVSLAVAWVWLAIAIATERRAGRRDPPADDGDPLTDPPSNVRRID